MSHHTEHDHERKKSEPEGATPRERAVGDHEVNPPDGPGPRGNPDRDEERIRRGLEDLERSGSN